jgi:hypothetical protein
MQVADMDPDQSRTVAREKRLTDPQGYDNWPIIEDRYSVKKSTYVEGN